MELKFEKDYDNLRAVITSKYEAPLDVIWDAFTNASTMEKWFAPEPYKAITKEVNFSIGGRWLYYMLSPEGEKYWSFAEYKNIEPKKFIELTDGFCDEEGVIDDEFPSTTWLTSFNEHDGVTSVRNELLFTQIEDMKQLFEMGFEEGYRMALDQLQALLKK